MNTLNKHRLANWSKAPEWAQFHCIDFHGEGYFYGVALQMSRVDGMWHANPISIAKSSKFDLTDIDWRETLETRPDPELTDGMTALVEELQTLRRRLSNKAELQSDPEIESLREENARLHERLNRLTLDRINSEERHDPI